jgi:TnpA family transposase
VRKLAGHPRQNQLFVALREMGRMERSLFTWSWLQDPELRRRVTAGLNQGEGHHTLKRAIRFYKRGSAGDRNQLQQDLNAMGYSKRPITTASRYHAPIVYLQLVAMSWSTGK